MSLPIFLFNGSDTVVSINNKNKQKRDLSIDLFIFVSPDSRYTKTNQLFNIISFLIFLNESKIINEEDLLKTFSRYNSWKFKSKSSYLPNIY